MVHAPQPDFKQTPGKRFKRGAFPSKLSIKALDPHMLRYWDAAQEGDAARRFLYNYRIIEYGASYYLEKDCRTSLQKLLAAPNALDDTARITDHLLRAIQETKLNDVQRFDAIVKDSVDPALLWDELSHNLTFFCSATIFDGGFIVEPIARPNWTETDFSVNGIGAFSKAVRSIRNALAHGKEVGSTNVITPTSNNFHKLSLAQSTWSVLVPTAWNWHF